MDLENCVENLVVTVPPSPKTGGRRSFRAPLTPLNGQNIANINFNEHDSRTGGENRLCVEVWEEVKRREMEDMLGSFKQKITQQEKLTKLGLCTQSLKDRMRSEKPIVTFSPSPIASRIKDKPDLLSVTPLIQKWRAETGNIKAIWSSLYNLKSPPSENVDIRDDEDENTDVFYTPCTSPVPEDMDPFCEDELVEKESIREFQSRIPRALRLFSPHRAMPHPSLAASFYMSPPVALTPGQFMRLKILKSDMEEDEEASMLEEEIVQAEKEKCNRRVKVQQSLDALFEEWGYSDEEDNVIPSEECSKTEQEIRMNGEAKRNVGKQKKRCTIL